MTEWFTIAEIVGLLAGFAAGMRVLWSLGKYLKKKWKKMFGLDALKTNIDTLSDQMSFLVSEMHPNGGTSIRDALDRIEDQISLTSERSRGRWLDAPEMLFETDDEGEYIWVNRTYTRGVQRSLVELLGSGWVNVIAIEDRETVVASWYKAVKEDREFDMEFNFRTPDGVSFPIHCRSYKMTDRFGEPIGYLGSCERV